MNVLVLYHATQTYTNTVFEHLNAFARFSKNRYWFCHHDGLAPLDVDLSAFDVVVVHYTLRLAFSQISAAAAERLRAYGGLKILFIQDEYDHTHCTWEWIKRLDIRLVFTVVPEPHIARIYPPAEFPRTRFVSNLTGYVPEELTQSRAITAPSQRGLVVGYRGRALPSRYGVLGQEKVNIGRMVKAYCDARGIRNNIAWAEESRIYGPKWYEFLASCRAMLGSESGSNVFDWDGQLQARMVQYRLDHPWASEEDCRDAVVAPLEMPGVMNQVSPRVFEAISMRTALVLFEGTYSGVVEPERHYIPLRKDGRNLDEVMARLRDSAFVDAMAERAWHDVIASGRYGYPAFVAMTDGEIDRSIQELGLVQAAARKVPAPSNPKVSNDITTVPIRWRIPSKAWVILGRVPFWVWDRLPYSAKQLLRPIVRKLLLPLWRGLRAALRREN